ncbi:hypothetical protein XACJK2_1470001 [Xanthomonas citri pv. citri]|nr:hypothetical protein XACJK2_1470001 [Xanthomonas citri pv. citri]
MGIPKTLTPFYWKIYSFFENLEWSNSLTR